MRPNTQNNDSKHIIALPHNIFESSGMYHKERARATCILKILAFSLARAASVFSLYRSVNNLLFFLGEQKTRSVGVLTLRTLRARDRLLTPPRPATRDSRAAPRILCMVSKIAKTYGPTYGHG